LALLTLLGCTAAPQTYRGIEVGQERSAAMAAVDRLWSLGSGPGCWPSYQEYAAATADHSGGRRTRNTLAYYCFADEYRWLIWHREDSNLPQLLTIVDVRLERDRVTSIEVKREFYIDL